MDATIFLLPLLLLLVTTVSAAKAVMAMLFVCFSGQRANSWSEISTRELRSADKMKGIQIKRCTSPDTSNNKTRSG